MPRRGEAPRPTFCVGLESVAAACCTRSATAVPGVRGSTDTAAALFGCGSSGDVATDTTQVIGLFSAAKSICCDDLGEQCEVDKPLPESCSTTGCSRAVGVVAQSCAPAFAADGFIAAAFAPSLAQVVADCNSAATDPNPAYVITDPGLQAAPTTTCHGRVIDGAGSEFHTSVTGQDKIVLQAPQGMQLQVTAEAMHFSPHGNVRVYDGANIDAPQLGLLRGTTLPEQVKDREFVSSKGVLTVMRVVDLQDDAGLPLMFSLTVECICSDGADGCGAHGSCVNGLCKCDEGYGGGMCETIVDKCEAPIEVDCGAHGSCDDGNCVCTNKYSGPACTVAPKPCCSSYCGAYCCISGSCSKCGSSCCGSSSYCRQDCDCDCSCTGGS